jgi:hypothetical protein
MGNEGEEDRGEGYILRSRKERVWNYDKKARKELEV